ncbi:TIGR04076 family protein [Megasphaera cerevisiae]|jgi:uncharacterized repeat protein (TIGR04076 family)|uniref:TIGR04076 family protein n=1 Tax=Megasphaera cerevisiae TaxID=39029 RepID=UPI000945484E|nr:TIGR04076 family protein [Megasphaera cerevisiae]MCI1751248.1 TIGR04076 family protein [Megasphaera cerevisiae]OKY52392.1 TIGR04076 family protein [Megasphaera cerevisiae]
MSHPKITLKLIDKKGSGKCHHNHLIGDSFDFDTDRGRLCPMVLHVAFPYIDILRYGGKIPLSLIYNKVVVCCPDADVINIFEIQTNDSNK